MIRYMWVRDRHRERERESCPAGYNTLNQENETEPQGIIKKKINKKNSQSISLYQYQVPGTLPVKVKVFTIHRLYLVT